MPPLCRWLNGTGAAKTLLEEHALWRQMLVFPVTAGER